MVLSALCPKQFPIILVLCTVIASAQQPASQMREYLYASEGFAIKFPYAPQPHADRLHPDWTVYTVRLAQRAAVSIRIIEDSQPCGLAFNKLKELAASDNTAIREFSVGGRPAWEEKDRDRGDGNMIFERYVCGRERYYVLSFGWPAREPKPNAGMRIIDSFRLTS